MQDDDPQFYSMNVMGHCLTDATIGIIGMGNIGLKIAFRAKAFNMNVVYHNRSRRYIRFFSFLQSISKNEEKALILANFFFLGILSFAFNQFNFLIFFFQILICFQYKDLFRLLILFILDALTA